MRYKQAKAYVWEVLKAVCPHCGTDYEDEEPGWRDRRELAKVRCQNYDCQKIFALTFK